MKKRSALIFGLLAALLALSMVLTGCSTDAEDEGPGPAKFPAVWTGTDPTTTPMWGENTSYPCIYFLNGPVAGSVLVRYTSPSSDSRYKLKSFTGDGTGSGSFTVKALSTSGKEEVGEEITVTYTYNATGPTITLVSAAITGFGSGGTTFTKVSD